MGFNSVFNGLMFIGHFEVHRTGSYKWRCWGKFRFSI